jgi:TDG/mug DNA glycosylase family protein
MDRATVDVYEQRANEWRSKRSPTQAARATSLGRDAHARSSRPVVDLGCGPGWFTSAIGEPVIALDAARAMLDLARDAAPYAPLVQASVDALPFRRGSLAGALAAKIYVHVPRSDVPMALADLHRVLEIGAPVELEVFGGDEEFGAFPDDDFAGRHFSLWPEQRLRDVVEGAGFAVDRWEQAIGARDRVTFHVRATRARMLADHVAPQMRLLLCGLNPSLYAADAGVGFARPGNRFWPAALEAGIVSRDRDALHALRMHGIGMTDLVKRATARADELTNDEYRAGLARVERLCAWLQPRALCVVGLAGWRAAVDRRSGTGVQSQPLGGVPVYVMPNPSGLNAHATVPVLAAHLRAAAALADG